MIRHSSDGLWIDGQHTFGDDLKRLVRDGKVKIVREQIKFDRKARETDGREFMRPGARMSKVIPTDGVYLRIWPSCPCCKASSQSFRMMRHKLNCSLRLDQYEDAKKKNGRIIQATTQRYAFQ
jgi:hypothetical protein